MARDTDVMWDDEGFKRRLEAQCKLRNVEVKDVLLAAGVSRYYLNKQVEGRSTNTVMKLARVVGLPPQELAFGVFAGSVAMRTEISGTHEIGQLFTAQQVMALLCLALNQKKSGREEVTELMLRAAHGGRRAESQTESDGSDANIASSTESPGIAAK